MNSWINSFYYFIIGASLLLSVMGLWFTILIPGIDRWSKRFFLVFFILLLLSSLSVLIELVLFHYPVPGGAIYFLLILETLLISLPMPMQMAYLLHCCGENVRSSKPFQITLGLWTVYLVLLVSVPFVGGFITITPENLYDRDSLYPLLMLPLIVILLFNFIQTMRFRSRLSRKAFLSFVIAQVPLAVALIVNMFVDALPVFDISYILSALAMYSLILSDQIEQELNHQKKIVQQQTEIARQQREIANQRTNVMVLQMRPHFIYNTLISIYSLCRLDPQKARQVTMDFTNYLRRNFNAVASDSPIPFSTELEHTRAYLAVEQAQYDDMLVVDYDTPYTHFRLPPLTLQPIVENAVKHGMNPDADPLSISIQTRHKNDGTEIIVEDNGCGFDPSDESRPHTALENIRQRLAMMCEGAIEVMSRDEGGTRVVVTIPDRETSGN